MKHATHINQAEWQNVREGEDMLPSDDFLLHSPAHISYLALALNTYFVTAAVQMIGFEASAYQS